MKGTEYPGVELERYYAIIDEMQENILKMVRKINIIFATAITFPWVKEYLRFALDDHLEHMKDMSEDEYIEAVVYMSQRMAEVGMPMAECAEAFAELADLAVAEDAPKRKKFPRPAAVIGPRPRTTVPSRYLAQARRCKRLPRAGMKCPQ